MAFDELLTQVLELLRRDGRVSYRALKRRFDLDEEYLEDLKAEIIQAKKLAVDEDGAVLVWTGVSLPAEAQTLMQELVGTLGSLQETVEALTTIATEMMPQKQQRRLSHLLWKNQDGVITAKEEAELDTLVAAGQQATLRKAKALLALTHLGIDIMPALEARVRSASG